MILKRDLLDRILGGQPPDPMTVVRQPLVIHEAMRIFKVLEQFKRAPVRLATILNEYGVLEGIVTQTDLLEAIAGDLAQVEGKEPEVVEREDGSLLIDGMMSAQEAFDRLNLRTRPAEGGFHTLAGFMLRQLGRLPKVGEHFDYEGWRFEVVDLDGRRIDKLLTIPPKAEGEE
jgi:CBS domain containing-hemolysin-like protein